VSLIEFKCPHCGENILEEVSYAEVRYTIDTVEKDIDEDINFEVGPNQEPIIDLQGLKEYMCGCCLEPIATTKTELYEWLEEQGMIENDQK